MVSVNGVNETETPAPARPDRLRFRRLWRAGRGGRIATASLTAFAVAATIGTAAYAGARHAPRDDAAATAAAAHATAESGSASASESTAAAASPSATASAAPQTAVPDAKGLANSVAPVASSSPSTSAATTPDDAVAAAVSSLIGADSGAGAVSVENLSTGAIGSYDGTDDQYDTASIVKVDILATLLLQHQQAGTALSSDEQSEAVTMIENSDNDSATDLYDDDGEAPGITAANAVFGLTGTTVGTDGYWGETSTTTTDQIRLLQVVFGADSPLTSANQQYIRNLMAQVESDQDWGVSAAADGGTVMLKNGWLPNPTLWEINSIGEIQYQGQTYLVAVLSDNQDSESDGIDFVQQIAVDAVDAMAEAGY